MHVAIKPKLSAETSRAVTKNIKSDNIWLNAVEDIVQAAPRATRARVGAIVFSDTHVSFADVSKA
jgi:hypothetical protein